MKRHDGVWVGGMVGLLVEGALKEAIGDCGLAGSSMLATPEAAGLGGLDCIAGHWELEEMRARENCSGKRGGEVEDLSSPFEDLLVHGLELGWRRGDELAGVRKPGDEDAAQHVDYVSRME